MTFSQKRQLPFLKRAMGLISQERHARELTNSRAHFLENAAFPKDATPISAKCADWRNQLRTLELWRRSLEISGGTLETWAAQNAGSEFSKVPAPLHSAEMKPTLHRSATF